MAQVNDLLANYRHVLTESAPLSPESERQLYRVHLEGLRELESAFAAGSRDEVARIVKRERRAFGWSYLSGEHGAKTEAAFHALATVLEVHGV